MFLSPTMNADLDRLFDAVDAEGYDALMVAHENVSVPVTYDGASCDPKVGLRRFLRAMLGDRYSGDRAALHALLAPSIENLGECSYVLFGPARATLLKAAETDADLRTALAESKMEVFEQNMYTVIRATLATEAEGWTTRAEELEKKAADLRTQAAALEKKAHDKVENAKEIRDFKRQFDEAFAATPETGVFVERPPKVPRVDEEKDEKSCSYSEPQPSSEESESD